MSNTTPSPSSPSVCTDATIEVAKGHEVAVRLYGRKKAGEVLPLVVHFHGGAFVSGDLDNGCTVGGLLEAAGGNLAAGVCLMARDQSHPPLAGQILLSPMLDPCVGTPSLRAATGEATACKWSDGWLKFLRCTRDAEHPYAVPGAAQRLAGLPPTLVLVGSEDPMRDEALAYAARLEAAGLAVMRHVFTQVEQWPDALLQPGTNACPCAAQVQEQFRLFFEATRCPAPL